MANGFTFFQAQTNPHPSFDGRIGSLRGCKRISEMQHQNNPQGLTWELPSTFVHHLGKNILFSGMNEFL